MLAIAGLLAGRFYGWLWMDPLMGVVGGVVIARWAWLLLRDSGAVLLDMQADPDAAARIRAVVEAEGASVADLHLWSVGPGHRAAIVSIVAQRPRPDAHYRRLLNRAAPLSHLTIEIRPAAV